LTRADVSLCANAALLMIIVYCVVQKPLSRRRKRTSCCLCCKKGPLSLSVQLDRSAYACGESLRLKADINNRSQEDVRLRLRLVQVFTRALILFFSVPLPLVLSSTSIHSGPSADPFNVSITIDIVPAITIIDILFVPRPGVG
jgi:hypothetical protein